VKNPPALQGGRPPGRYAQQKPKQQKRPSAKTHHAANLPKVCTILARQDILLEMNSLLCYTELTESDIS
jgi:hypothetical protein